MRVMIGFAAGSHVLTPFAMSLADIAAYASPHYDYVGAISVQGSLIDHARNEIVNQFLASDADYLFMVDTDLEFHVDIIDQLVAMREPAGCGWYNIRIGQTPRPAILRFETDTMSSCVEINADSPVYFPADAGPSGAMFIHRGVFNAMRDAGVRHYFKFTHTDAGTVTEDIHFCRLLKQFGYTLMVCRDAHMRHHKVQAL